MMLTSGRLCRIVAPGTPCPPKRRVRFARRRTPQEGLFGIHAKLQLSRASGVPPDDAYCNFLQVGRGVLAEPLFGGRGSPGIPLRPAWRDFAGQGWFALPGLAKTS